MSDDFGGLTLCDHLNAMRRPVAIVKLLRIETPYGPRWSHVRLGAFSRARGGRAMRPIMEIRSRENGVSSCHFLRKKTKF